MASRIRVNPDNDANLGQYLEALARHFWGRPLRITETEIRWGRQGSKAVDRRKQVWFDHERHRGGGTLDLVAHETGVGGSAAVRWLEDNGFKPASQPAAGHTAGPIAATYDYTDAEGRLLFQVCRLSPKSFRQRQPDGSGGWRWRVQGVTPVPYRLPALLARPQEQIFLVEGEKDADALTRLGLLASCNAGGAGKWPVGLNRFFAGRDIVILPDRDEAGAAHARLIEQRLSGVAASLRVLELPVGEKGDVSDWLAAGGTVAALLAASAQAPERAGVAPETASAAPDRRTRTIAVEPGRIHEVADQGEAAILAAGLPIFQRGGMLVRPITEQRRVVDGADSPAPALAEVNLHNMVDYLARAAQWEKWDSRAGCRKSCMPSRDVANIILARRGEWRFPALSGVIATPTLRPDGSILARPGYDPVTRLYLKDPLPLPPLPDAPSRDDAERALALLRDLLCEFPIRDAASHAVALSALITPVARGAMATAPLHVLSAATAGSGKSYLVDLASIIATGAPAAVTAAAPRDDETEKRLSGLMLSGDPILSIDNVNGDLGGDFLCQMVSQPMVKVRALGSSQMLTIENRALCFATGNNIRLSGDMTRRGVICTLDPEMEKPETRIFHADPVQKILRNRGNYVAAALLICRAYRVAGSPDPLPPVASFEGWSRIVRSALVWLGCADPALSMHKASEDDPVATSLREVLEPLYQAIGSQAKTAAEIRDLAEETGATGKPLRPELYEGVLAVARDSRGRIETRRLGNFCKRYNHRILDGLKIVHVYDKHSKKNKYRIEQVVVP